MGSQEFISSPQRRLSLPSSISILPPQTSRLRQPLPLFPFCSSALRPLPSSLFFSATMVMFFGLRLLVVGHGTLNLNKLMLPNTSIRGSASFSTIPNSSKIRKRIDGVSDADFQKGFEEWCERYGKTFSSEEDKRHSFQRFCDDHPYGRSFRCGCLPTIMSRKELIDLIRNHPIGGDLEGGLEEAKAVLWKKLRQAEPDVDDKDDLSWDELNEILDECARQRRMGNELGSRGRDRQ